MCGLTMASAFIAPGGSLALNVTLPEEQLCHYITDDELVRLGEMNDDPLMNICLLTAGAFAGAVVPAAQSLRTFFVEPLEFGGVDLLSVLVAVVTLSIALLTGYLSNRKKRVHKSLVEKIRERPRVPVQVVTSAA